MLSPLRRVAEALLLSQGERRLLELGREAEIQDVGAGGAEDPPWLGHAGIDLEEEPQLALLGELEAAGYQDLFARLRAEPRLRADPPLRADPRLGTDPPSDAGAGQDLVRNGYFPSPDAELYAALLMRERPRRVVEVGSGFSTRVARVAIEHVGLDCSLDVIDPEPRVDVARDADRVERAPVERSVMARGLADELGPGTVLFIDSSHRAVAGGDAPFLFCRLIPALPSGTLVHVHDIHLPWDYPAVYRRRLYDEQYLVHSLLAHSRRLRVVCAAYFLSRSHPEAMRRAFGPRVAQADRFQGASLWLRVD